MILRVRVLLPISQPPIDDGAVWIQGNRIVEVGRWRDLAGSGQHTIDLGSTILLPGLVNAHCHLDYTEMAGLIPPPKVFTTWINHIVALKGQWTYSDYAHSWLSGARMLLRTGVTTVADSEAVPELLPEVSDATPLRVHSFLEMTGVQSRRAPRDVLGEAARKVESLPPARGKPGLSPHAPYSTTPELLRLTAQLARQKDWRLVTHVAESAPELEMYMERRGPLFDWLKSQRDMSDCGSGSPVHHLDRCGLLGKNLLAVHANYLTRADERLLAAHEVSVVHCPRSHAYFGHQRFPIDTLSAAGVNLCLGTDSLASVYKKRAQPIELNLLTEMQALSASNPELAPETILLMGTMNGAKALGLEGKLGQLSKQATADLIAVPFSGKLSDAAHAVVHHSGPISASLIDGQWAIEPELD
ncbi:MAG: amidohydrolase family protein [Verrucomicrobiota bacterium]